MVDSHAAVDDADLAEHRSAISGSWVAMTTHPATGGDWMLATGVASR
jgi:hypothetical protein